ncbi:hypothetical protein NC653_004098 [Populus alba x Populus x berolinensis]|uniref:Uncharacterized protein n=1 Tax=Populus alba x Populus x berolinensis TaxID=444605 RepID=A0AAD6RT67_9ROSI|nr:hypothetical protein NC653_004098 [Populus alba x Populus x berolinensis]
MVNESGQFRLFTFKGILGRRMKELESGFFIEIEGPQMWGNNNSRGARVELLLQPEEDEKLVGLREGIPGKDAREVIATLEMGSMILLWRWERK